MEHIGGEQSMQSGLQCAATKCLKHVDHMVLGVSMVAVISPGFQEPGNQEKPGTT